VTGNGAPVRTELEPPSPDPIAVGWDELDALVGRLATAIGRDYDLVLAITRGGLVPAGILAYRLDLREILVAGVEFYTGDGGRTPRRSSPSFRPRTCFGAAACW